MVSGDTISLCVEIGDGDQGIFIDQQLEALGQIVDADGFVVRFGSGKNLRLKASAANTTPIRIGTLGSGSGGGYCLEPGESLDRKYARNVTRWHFSTTEGTAVLSAMIDIC